MFNARNKEAVQKWRKKVLRDEDYLEPERRKMRDWVRTSSIDEVKHWLNLIERRAHMAELRKPGPK
jgi:hypothetical protein